MAASESSKESVWLRRLYSEDFGYNDLSLVTKGDLSESEYAGKQPMTVFEDNQSCIYLSRNPTSHKTSKHIAIRYHFTRELVQQGIIKLVKIDTKLNLADILTKPCSKATFTFLRDRLMSPHEEVPDIGSVGVQDSVMAVSV